MAFNDEFFERVARIGVYICHCGQNIAGVIDVERVSLEIGKEKYIVASRTFEHFCSETGQNMIKMDIEELKLNRVIIAACSPRMHENTFRKMVESAGLNPYLLEIANLREHCSWVHEHDPSEATEKAIDLIRMAIARAKHLKPLEKKEVEVVKNCLVIGGGIAGIQSALDVADAGFKVFLIEKSPSIGGRMAQLGKVFPTMDCSQCILTPKMSDIATHSNIRLYTNSEVTNIRGSFGDFTVTINKNPRYINEEKCTGCGTCAEKCPKKVPNEFDFGISSRKAAYIPFSQAIPHKYVIDRSNCLYFQKGICRVCEKFCTSEAIEFNQEPEYFDLNVGTIIVSTGYDPFPAEQIPRYGYGLYQNVITGPIFERIASPFGPTDGKILRLSDKQPPKSIAFLLCVGSRDEKLKIGYCSRVCCMYTCKHAQLIKEQLPDTEVSIFYMDIRAFGKGYEEFYQRTQESGVHFIRGRVADINEVKDTKNLKLRYEDTLLGRTMTKEVEMVVLAVGQRPRDDADVIARILNIPKGIDGFYMEAHPKLRPHDTPVEGIFLAGTCHYPKDICDTVSQASGAAAKAIIPLGTGKVAIEPIVAEINPVLCSGCRICESTCEFQAIEIIDNFGKLRATVNEKLCKGCGGCTAACPMGAINANHFTDIQIFSQINAILLESK